ncbi:hypothetical protein M9H77_30341 [Catharanthus roseus]|uniref:Uncharacterized protein n=1 Tax=Catharanthus roseus TaxID=4058 RepID=A0ACB9ZXA8_CATRO|nr:hypothetical protein M9H77_30341 [Catharanthus roseus]
MGSMKKKEQKQKQMLPETADKEHKKRLRLRPKKSETIKKTKFKKIKTKEKKKKDLINSRSETESKMNGKNENLQTEKVGKKDSNKKRMKTKQVDENRRNNGVVERPTAAQQLRYFLHQYQSGNGIQLSSIELESFKDELMLELFQVTDQNIISLGEYMKLAFGSSWKEVLYEKQLREGKVDPGNPAVLVISLSALRSLELLREFRPLTKECHAVKLFSKHIKIEEQVSSLKNRVNIACGTPKRIKKLIDMEALGLSRLAVIVLDMYTDVKGYSLLTLPQIREEFWDLYKSYFHDQLLEGNLRICLFGRIPDLPEARIEATDD